MRRIEKEIFGTGPEHDARGNTNVFEYHESLADIATILAFLVVAFRVFFIFKKKEFHKASLVMYCLLTLICSAKHPCGWVLWRENGL
ncbi:hypothetical protein [Bacillus sp. AFS031507]|uniref:hypothetical protein n=1 Tax=Bacillus sp. AFS031507 TaxID=2033496 RepID=UPI000BFBCF26|nr:hypothetical protein [Bacillus sp. AFS031507]PGY10336.1 hypothetical protein COE25_15470 [Bacillus sp. AFS031507]